MLKKACLSSFPCIVAKMSLIGVSWSHKCIPEEYAARMPSVSHAVRLSALTVYVPS